LIPLFIIYSHQFINSSRMLTRIQWQIYSINDEILRCKDSMNSIADHFHRGLQQLRDQELDIKDHWAAERRLVVAFEPLACEFERLDSHCRGLYRRIDRLTSTKVRLQIEAEDIEIENASISVRTVARTEFKRSLDSKFQNPRSQFYNCSNNSDLSNILDQSVIEPLTTVATSISTTPFGVPSSVDPSASSESIASTLVVISLPVIAGLFTNNICSAEADNIILPEILPASIPSTLSVSDRMPHNPSLSTFQQEFGLRYVISSIVVCHYEFDPCLISCMQLFGSIFHSAKPLGFILLVFDPGLSSIV
jgi:hypothetical protein